MRENFPACLSFVLHGRGAYRGEAGFVDNPHDPGGPTNKGITLRTLSSYLNRAASLGELRNLSDATAGAIYKSRYWDPLHLDNISVGLDLMLFDISVNSGPKEAELIYRQTLSGTTEQRIHAVDSERLGFWRHLRSWPFFRKGWCARENACLCYALEMEKNP